MRLEDLGERTVWLDCDVIQADGGPNRRDHRRVRRDGPGAGQLRQADTIKSIPVNDYLAATSVGVVGGTPMLDLAYEEESRAEVDMNVVQTGEASSSRCKALPKRSPSIALRSTRCWRWRITDHAAGRATARHRRRNSRPMTTAAPATTNPNRDVSFERSRRRGHRGRRPRSVRRHRAARRNGDDLRGERRAQSPLRRRGHGSAGHCRGLGREIDALHGQPGVESARLRRRFDLPGKSRELYAMLDAAGRRRTARRAPPARLRWPTATTSSDSPHAACSERRTVLAPALSTTSGPSYLLLPPRSRTLAEVGDDVNSRPAVSHGGAACIRKPSAPG